MKTKITARIGLLVAMLLTILPVSAYDFEVDGIYYEVISLTDLTCKVVSGDTKYEGDIVIPSEVTYNSKTLIITHISDKAFYGCSSLTSVVIGNYVTEIGDYAFYACRSLSSVIIGNSVTEIGDEAFNLCDSLSSVIIPDSVTEIGDYAFYECSSLTSVVIGNSVTEIGDYAFGWCKSLIAVTIPDSVMDTGVGTFYACSSLPSVTIPESVTKIGGSAFSNCSSLPSVTIPESVTEIGGSAFSGCSSLTSVTIPESVTEIGGRAFSGCSSLKEIKLSSALETLYYGTFNDCESLQSLTIPGSVTKLEQFLRDYISHNGEDMWYLFGGCNALKEIKFEYGVKEILGYYYLWSSHVRQEPTNITLSKNQDTLLGLENVFIDRELGNSLELPYLKKLTLGEHVEEVQIIPFESEDLETITCYASVPPICPEFTNSQYMDVTVKVPQQSLEAYQSADGWKNFWNLQGFDATGINNVTPENKITEVGRYDLNGKAITADYEGIGVIRYSDGSTKKIVVRK